MLILHQSVVTSTGPFARRFPVTSWPSFHHPEDNPVTLQQWDEENFGRAFAQYPCVCDGLVQLLNSSLNWNETGKIFNHLRKNVLTHAFTNVPVSAQNTNKHVSHRDGSSGDRSWDDGTGCGETEAAGTLMRRYVLR